MLKGSVQSTGQNTTTAEQPVPRPYPGVWEKLLQALSEAGKDILSLETIACP